MFNTQMGRKKSSFPTPAIYIWTQEVWMKWTNKKPLTHVCICNCIKNDTDNCIIINGKNLI